MHYYFPLWISQASPTPQKQASISSILARASSLGSGSSGSGPTRQGSQNSLLDQFTSSAKELIKDRQNSQEGSFLSQVDKVRRTSIIHNVCTYTQQKYNCRLLYSWIFNLFTEKCDDLPRVFFFVKLVVVTKILQTLACIYNYCKCHLHTFLLLT